MRFFQGASVGGQTKWNGDDGVPPEVVVRFDRYGRMKNSRRQVMGYDAEQASQVSRDNASIASPLVEFWWFPGTRRDDLYLYSTCICVCEMTILRVDCKSLR